MKNMVLLGATGNLGVQTLEVIEKHADNCRLTAISGHKNSKLLNKIARRFRIPKENVVLTSKNPRDLNRIITGSHSDIVINMLSGVSGIGPSLEALKNNKTLLPGNKESIVVEGEEIMRLSNGNLIPLDSEHNAIYEILQENKEKKVEKIYLPCSGGPFLNYSAEELAKATIKDALSHPRWNMGPKISIESATLINKGLEIIEAHYLFEFPLQKIEVFIHPRCEIHGMVKFEGVDGFIAYVDRPDMRTHIENAISRALELTPTNRLRKLDKFTIVSPDHSIFPGISLVLENFQKGTIREFLKFEEDLIRKAIDQNYSFEELITSLKAGSNFS